MMKTTAVDTRLPEDIVSSESAPAPWITKEKDPVKTAKDSFAVWLKTIDALKGVFVKHVYQNESLEELDLRQHRSRLHAMISAGEELAGAFLVLNENDARSYILVIDEQVKALAEELHQWHGPLEEQDDIPDSFKEASREVRAGDLEEFETGALSGNA